MTNLVAQPSNAKTRVYLDQNVFSNIARTSGNWRENEYARILLEDASQSAEVWISPTHVVELALCPDLDFRRQLAEVMLALCGGRRMMPDYGILLVNGFLEYVEKACAGSILSQAYPAYYDNTLKQIFLGALALMATGHEPSRDVIDRVTRWKLESRWLRAEAGKNPHAWVVAVRECANELRLVPGPSRPELAAKTLDELVAEIRNLEAQARRIDKKDRTTVENERALLVRAYAVGDVVEALSTTFGQLPGDLHFTFDFSHLSAKWTSIVAKLKCRPFPTELAPEQYDVWILDELTRGLWRPDNGGISAASLAQEILFRDYVDRLNETNKERTERIKKEGDGLPTDSLTFDADHAALALSRAHVFVTRDQVLLNSCKTVSSAWRDCIKWECRPVFSPEQVRKSLTT